jgi:hypothetical protein
LLAYLDQYYRRGKIPADSFNSLKSHLERLLLGADSGKPAYVAPEPQPEAAPAAAPAAHVGRNRGSDRAYEEAITRPHAEQPDAPARNAVQPLGAGDSLRGRYRILGVLGRGGMGVVYLALDSYRLDEPADDQRVALKVLHSEVVKRPRLLAELRREFRHLQKLAHPNIVRVHEFDRDGELAFFTMEYLSGVPLGRMLAQPESYALRRDHALTVARAVGSAIAHAHSRGVVHGDLNPGNVFLTDEGEVRVLDFGASYQLHRGPWISEFDAHPQMAVATPSFASCQVLEGEAADARDDVYAFACVLYLLLAGRHPFAGETAQQARARRLDPRRPPGLRAAQWRALQEGLRFERERRPASIAEWLTRLDLDGAGGADRLPPLRDLRTTVRSPRRSAAGWVGALAGIAAAGLALGGWWLAHQPGAVADALAALRTRRDAPRTAPPATATEPAPPAAAPTHRVPPAMALPPTPQAQPARAQVPPRVTAAPVASAPPSAAAARADGPSPSADATAPPRTAPPATAPPPARLSTGSPAAATASSAAAAGRVDGARSRIEMAADNVETPNGELMARIVVHRTRSVREDVSFNWWTESGTAMPGRDFVPVKTRVEHLEKGKESISLLVPLIDARPHAKPRSFYVVIDEPSNNATLGPRNLTMVTIPGTE